MHIRKQARRLGIGYGLADVTRKTLWTHCFTSCFGQQSSS